MNDSECEKQNSDSSQSKSFCKFPISNVTVRQKKSKKCNKKYLSLIDEEDDFQNKSSSSLTEYAFPIRQSIVNITKDKSRITKNKKKSFKGKSENTEIEQTFKTDQLNATKNELLSEEANVFTYSHKSQKKKHKHHENYLESDTTPKINSEKLETVSDSKHVYPTNDETLLTQTDYKKHNNPLEVVQSIANKRKQEMDIFSSSLKKHKKKHKRMNSKSETDSYLATTDSVNASTTASEYLVPTTEGELDIRESDIITKQNKEFGQLDYKVESDVSRNKQLYENTSFFSAKPKNHKKKQLNNFFENEEELSHESPANESKNNSVSTVCMTEQKSSDNEGSENLSSRKKENNGIKQALQNHESTVYKNKQLYEDTYMFSSTPKKHKKKHKHEKDLDNFVEFNSENAVTLPSSKNFDSVTEREQSNRVSLNKLLITEKLNNENYHLLQNHETNYDNNANLCEYGSFSSTPTKHSKKHKQKIFENKDSLETVSKISSEIHNATNENYSVPLKTTKEIFLNEQSLQNNCENDEFTNKVLEFKKSKHCKKMCKEDIKIKSNLCKSNAYDQVNLIPKANYSDNENKIILKKNRKVSFSDTENTPYTFEKNKTVGNEMNNKHNYKYEIDSTICKSKNKQGFKRKSNLKQTSLDQINDSIKFENSKTHNSSDIFRELNNRKNSGYEFEDSSEKSYKIPKTSFKVDTENIETNEVKESMTELTKKDKKILSSPSKAVHSSNKKKSAKSHKIKEKKLNIEKIQNDLIAQALKKFALKSDNCLSSVGKVKTIKSNNSRLNEKDIVSANELNMHSLPDDPLVDVKKTKEGLLIPLRKVNSDTHQIKTKKSKPSTTKNKALQLDDEFKKNKALKNQRRAEIEKDIIQLSNEPTISCLNQEGKNVKKLKKSKKSNSSNKKLKTEIDKIQQDLLMKALEKISSRKSEDLKSGLQLGNKSDSIIQNKDSNSKNGKTHKHFGAVKEVSKIKSNKKVKPKSILDPLQDFTSRLLSEELKRRKKM